MRIAIINPAVTISHTGGVKVQCFMWKDGLEELGHDVELINIWNDNNWRSFDAIIIMGYDTHSLGYTRFLHSQNKNILLAPIIDLTTSSNVIKRLNKFGKLGKIIGHRYGIPDDLYNIKNHTDFIQRYLIRSDYEKSFLNAIGINDEKIDYVPLHFRVNPPSSMPTNKEDFVFIACLLADERKNVKRLVESAKKYGFKLVLAGTLRNEKERNWLQSLIEDFDNIKYIGRLSDEELFSYYERAKVFALPSLNEGVGMVALEAATFGCEIVLTNIGAPKEYYNGMAHLVNPYDIDDIGNSILDALNGINNSQPELRNYVIKNFCSTRCMQMLESTINSTKKDA